MSILKLGAHMSIAGGVSHGLQRASSIGSNAVQVFTKNNRQWRGIPLNKDDVMVWQKNIPCHEIAYVVSHASYLINLASPKQDLWEKSCHAHQDELQRAYAYGIPHVVLHPGAHTGCGEDAGIAHIAKALDKIHNATPECSHTITLLEAMAGQGTTLGYRFAQLSQMIEQVSDKSRVGICLDTCHIFAAGYDIRTEAGYHGMMTELETELGLDKVKCWHFNDSKGELGSRKDRHTHIGEGQIGEDGFRFILNDPRWYGIAMLLETPKKADLLDDVRNLQKLCTLVDDPQRIPAGLIKVAE